jgi:hypothetical protein
MRQIYIITGAIFVWIFFYGLLFALLQEQGAFEGLKGKLSPIIPWILDVAGLAPMAVSVHLSERAVRAASLEVLMRHVTLAAIFCAVPSLLGFLGSGLTNTPMFIAVGIGLSLVAFVTLGAYMPAVARRIADLRGSDED